MQQKALIVFSWEAILTHIILFIMLDLNMLGLFELKVEKQYKLRTPGRYVFVLL